MMLLLVFEYSGFFIEFCLGIEVDYIVCIYVCICFEGWDRWNLNVWLMDVCWFIIVYFWGKCFDYLVLIVDGVNGDG